MPCPRCRFDNPEGMNFCGRCGTKLTPSCPQCGFENPPGFAFCGKCGAVLGSLEPTSAPGPTAKAQVYQRQEGKVQSYTPRHLAEKILTARSALEGERRQVTVLFADVANFTTLAEQLDPEVVHDIMDRCFERITAEVHRFEGTINQYTGDGVMALFGAPIAHEDGPRRAVHAALAIQRALRTSNQEVRTAGSLALQMRIGINTGLVVVGKIGDDLRMDYTAVGDTTNLAARLQQNARPGSVVISEATHRLVTGFFEVLDLGEVTVKGRAPARAFEVLRPRGRRARLDVAIERGLTPLVGREPELATLLDRFREVKAGRGQVVCIAGEAGIGKSRLVLEFRRTLAEAREALTWLEGRCISFGQSIPFLPVIDQLRENFGIEEFDGEPEIIAKVEHGMRRMGGLEAHIPFIRYLLAVDPGEPAVAAMDAAARRKKSFDAGLALAVRGACIRPLVLVVEDLHWIDTSTEEYLAVLMDSVVAVPLLLLVTYRVGYAPPFGSRSFHTTLTLHNLSEAESLTLAGRVLGSEGFPKELRTALMEKAEGVPLFIEEVTKTLLDLGVLRQETGGYRLVKGLSEVHVPDTIQAIIMARLDRLGENGKRAVQLASVIGRQFLVRLLERISGFTGELEGLLRELKALEIVYEQGLLPEPAYVFKHAVIQDVAYQSLLVQRRKELHQAIGYAIEELYPDRLAEHYEELAHHFAQGEEWHKAMHYSTLAGDRAVHAFANAEAQKHYARALDAAGRHTPAPEPEPLASLHAKQGAVCMVLAEYEGAVDEYQQALACIRQACNRRQEIDILLGLGSVYSWYHRTEPALQCVNAALAIALDIDDRPLQASCLVVRGEAMAAGDGHVMEATPDLEEAVRLSKEIADPRLLARTLTFAGRNLQWRGEFERTIGHLQEGIELARREHAGFLLGLGLFSLGHAYLAKGEYDEALRSYHELREYAGAAGDKWWITRTPNCIGAVHLELYDLEEAVRLNEENDDLAKRLWPWPEPRGHSLVKLGLAHLYGDDHGRAQEAFEQAWGLLEADPWGRWRWHIPLLHARGELALAEGWLDEAWSFATQSLEMATQTDSRKHVARAQRLQGQILLASGRLDDAAQTLATSITLAERLQTPREVWLGKAVLGKVLARLGREQDAEVQYSQAIHSIEALAANLTTPSLRRSFLTAEPVLEVYRILGRSPQAIP